VTGVANRTGTWKDNGTSSDVQLVTCDMKDETKKTRRLDTTAEYMPRRTSLSHVRRLVELRGQRIRKGP
jgi:hypothetical protein